MKKIQNGFGLPGVLFVVIAAVLIGAMGYIVTHRSKTSDLQAAMPPLVRGVYGPQITAIDTFTQVPGLNDALKALSANNPCAPTEGRFKQIVLGVTADKTQALIGNSCGSTGVLRTFMIKNHGKWEAIGGAWKDEGSREDFSALTDTPSCQLVDHYDIQPAIAPVCFEKQAGASSLFAGDTTNYTYRSRQ